MLHYVWEGLKPSILGELKHQDLQLESFDQIVKETINTKAKTAF